MTVAIQDSTENPHQSAVLAVIQAMRPLLAIDIPARLHDIEQSENPEPRWSTNEATLYGAGRELSKRLLEAALPLWRAAQELKKVIA